MASIDTALGPIGVLEQSPEGPQGLPILFLHGVGSDKSVWAPQLDHFGRTRRAIAASLPPKTTRVFDCDDDDKAVLTSLIRLLPTAGGVT